MKSKKNWYLNKMLSLKERFVVSEKITSEWLEKLRLILREPDSFKKKMVQCSIYSAVIWKKSKVCA